MAEKIQIKIFPEVQQNFVRRYLYGHFAEHLGRCIYGGIWVGPDSKIENENGLRQDTTRALKKLALPVLRWPGGCFADNYHWQDGIGPREHRPQRYNLWWKQPETNQFGTHEFMNFCQSIGTEPYVCLNVGSGTVEEARSWVEYCNSDQPTTWAKLRAKHGNPAPFNVKFWGIGNENWGCGGSMRPEYYADLYRQYATYVRGTAGEGAQLIACGSHTGIPEWDERFLSAVKDRTSLIDHLALHIYSGGGSSDIEFSENEYFQLMQSIEIMNQNLTRAAGLVTAFSSANHKIGVVLDEWGTWFKQATVEAGLFQQNTLRDALFTASSFHLFHQHADKLFMTNMAQTVNVLQALVLTRGPQMLVTPTYHIYEMFAPHRDSHTVACQFESPLLAVSEAQNRAAVSISATISGDEQLFISFVNLDLKKSFEANLEFISRKQWEVAQIRQLTNPDIRAHNTFDAPETVAPTEIAVIQGKPGLTLPPKSITTVKLNPRHD
jgi:alpha-N-arabinofuranosidase